MRNERRRASEVREEMKKGTLSSLLSPSLCLISCRRLALLIFVSRASAPLFLPSASPVHPCLCIHAATDPLTKNLSLTASCLDLSWQANESE